MLGLTLPKILLAAVVIWLVWRLLRQPGNPNPGSRDERPSGRAGRGDRSNQRAVEDMVQCPKCGAYVPAKGGHDCEHGSRPG